MPTQGHFNSPSSNCSFDSERCEITTAGNAACRSGRREPPRQLQKRINKNLRGRFTSLTTMMASFIFFSLFVLMDRCEHVMERTPPQATVSTDIWSRLHNRAFSSKSDLGLTNQIPLICAHHNCTATINMAARFQRFVFTFRKPSTDKDFLERRVTTTLLPNFC